MKKNFILVIILILTLSSAIAQEKKFYARAGGGLNLKIASEYGLLYSYSNEDGQNTATVVPVGFGNGAHFSGAFGYMIKKYVGIEVAITQMVGFQNAADSLWKFPGGQALTGKMKGNMMCIVPACVITAGLEKVNPYARLGMIIGVLPMIRATSTFERIGSEGTDQVEASERFYGGLAAGVNGAMGVNWNLNDLITLYAEINFNGITWAPRYSEVTQYEVNGVDELGTLTEKQKNTEYYAKLNVDEQIPDTSPNKAFMKTFPFSNVGTSIGISFRF